MQKHFNRGVLTALAVLLASACSPTEQPEQENETARTQQPLSAQTGSLNVARSSFALTLLQDGKVLVTGGFSGSYTTTVERYDPATGVFSIVSSLATGRSHHTATLLQDGRVLVVGGYADVSTVTKTVEIYNPATGSWSNAAPTGVAHARHTATRLQDGRVLVTGGTSAVTATAIATDACEIYNPTTNTWSYAPLLPKARLDHTATFLPSGKVFVAGGTPYDDGTDNAIPAAEFEPSTNTWTPRPSPFASRTKHLAFLLETGSVLLVTGKSVGAGTGTVNSADLYDPATGNWSATPLTPGRYDAAGAVLADGRVLVASGYSGGAMASTAIYHPSTNTWSTGDSLVISRYWAQAVRLNDGRVLLASGLNSSFTRTPHAELYSACTPSVTCAAAGKNCGGIADGCGGTLNCGTCGSGTVCEDNVCVNCTPTTCAAAGKNCGGIADGCGGTLNCGTCGGTDVCSANVCVSCTPTTCAAQGRTCGTVSNGCGGTLSCGGCQQGYSCSSAGACFDSTSPTVAITSPTSGAVVTGTVTIQASASDNVGVVRTDFYVDGALIGSSTGPTYAVSWNSTTVANGSRVLMAAAIDARGNQSGIQVTVQVSNQTPAVVTALYDETLRVPRCVSVGMSCDSGSLLVGRGPMGPEAHAPNTLATSSCADGSAGTFHVDESLDRLKITTTDNTPLAPGKQVRIDATVWAYSSYTSDKLDLYYATNLNSPAWIFLTTLTPAGAGTQTLSHTFTLPSGAKVIRGRFRYGGSASSCATDSYNDHDDLVFAAYP